MQLPSGRSLKCRVALLLLLASLSALGQAPTRSSKAALPARPETEERDNPAARQAWFLRGRVVPGKNAAALLHRAFQQKIAIRRAQRQKAAQAAGTGAPTPSLSGGPTTMGQGIGPVWTNLGPSPITSCLGVPGSCTSFQNGSFSGGPEGNFSGRIQAVVVDPNDSTGNTVYVGSAYGGVWKTTNGTNVPASGVAWTSLFDTDPAAATLSVGAVTVLPCGGPCGPNGPVVLVGTGEPDNAIDSYYGQGILRFDPVANAWSLIASANGGTNNFRGMGFSKIAYSTAAPSLVVAAASAANFPSVSQNFMKGLYFSTDSGATWSLATINDPGNVQICIPAQNAPQGCSVGDVVFDPVNSTFYAAVRFHGFYSSTNGQTWTRVTDVGGVTVANCPNATSTTCPMFRGQLAVQPSTGDLYTVFIPTISGTTPSFFRANFTSGQLSGWTPIASAGVMNCGDGSVSNGCGASQGFYNLYIGAVPNGAGTDVYFGAVNLFKCSNPTGVSLCGAVSGTSNIWMNLTHVYNAACSSTYQTMHPDNHGFGSMVLANGSILAYFGNDGGVYRSLDSRNLTGGTNCMGNGNALDDLNTSTLGSLAQFIAISTHPTDPSVTFGGTQDNGSPATASGQTSPPLTNNLWFEAWIGDGGFNFIDPVNTNKWFTANTGVSVHECNSSLTTNPPNPGGPGPGTDCIEVDGFQDSVTKTQVGGDQGAFYTPFVFDPANTDPNNTKIIIGTCRVWRGTATVPASSSSLVALSGNLDQNNSTTAGLPCQGFPSTTPETDVSALAAGGPASGGLSQVIYAGTDGGHIWVTTNAAGGTGTWADRTGSINPGGFPIASVAVDVAGDATGQTAYLTIMGFTGGAGHVWKTINAGVNWTDITGNLPDAPVNSVLIDPNNHSIVYVGTDVGVFMTSNVNGVSTAWQEWGQSFPNVAVLSLAVAAPLTGSPTMLRAGTHGRGVFETQLASAAGYTLAISNSPKTVYVANLPAVFNGLATSIGTFNSPVNLSCTAGSTPPPATCAPAPLSVTPTGGGTAFTVTASDVVADYLFNLHGVGTDANSTTHDAPLTLHVVDFLLGAVPTSVTVQPTASEKVTLTVTAQGSFTDTVNVVCRLPLPTGVACGYSQNNFVPSNAGTAITVTISTTAATPLGSNVIHLDVTGSSPGAPTKTQDITLNVAAGPPALGFVAVPPCRVADTRNPNGPFGGPFLGANTTRAFAIPSSACGIPATAQAYSVNLTVVPKGILGFLTAWPCGQPQPLASNLNSLDGRIKAVAAIVPAGTGGDLCVFTTSDTELVIDINGYFLPTTSPTPPLAFYPLAPCRLVDTRLANGSLGGPFLPANSTRNFPLLSGSCGIPNTAQAYSLNYTVVPKGILGFLTTWPAGQTQPLVSTLNATTGAITANAAIVPAGTGGDVSVFVTSDTDLVIDVNGYFAPAGTGGLSLYTLPPCRVLDTRNPPGSPPFSGSIDINVVSSGCGAPTAAQAFVLNATVVPPGGLSFLTLWPQGTAQPLVSTLNALDGQITSNLAIVPTNNGSISAFAFNPTHLVIDISGYFGP